MSTDRISIDRVHACIAILKGMSCIQEDVIPDKSITKIKFNKFIDILEELVDHTPPGPIQPKNETCTAEAPKEPEATDQITFVGNIPLKHFVVHPTGMTKDVSDNIKKIMKKVKDGEKISFEDVKSFKELPKIFEEFRLQKINDTDILIAFADWHASFNWPLKDGDLIGLAFGAPLEHLRIDKQAEARNKSLTRLLATPELTAEMIIGIVSSVKFPKTDIEKNSLLLDPFDEIFTENASKGGYFVYVDQELSCIAKSANFVKTYKEDDNTATTQQDFNKRFKEFTCNVFEKPAFPWKNAAISGGCISRLMSKNSKADNISDVDIFVFGATSDERTKAIKNVAMFMYEPGKTYFGVNRSVIYIYRTDFARQFQIICSKAKTLYDIISNFDLSTSQWIYSNGKVLGTGPALKSLKTRVSIPLQFNSFQEFRIVKLLKQDYDIRIEDHEKRDLLETLFKDPAHPKWAFINDKLNKNYTPLDTYSPEKIKIDIKLYTGAKNVYTTPDEIFGTVVKDGDFVRSYTGIDIDDISEHIKLDEPKYVNGDFVKIKDKTGKPLKIATPKMKITDFQYTPEGLEFEFDDEDEAYMRGVLGRYADYYSQYFSGNKNPQLPRADALIYSEVNFQWLIPQWKIQIIQSAGVWDLKQLKIVFRSDGKPGRLEDIRKGMTIKVHFVPTIENIKGDDSTVIAKIFKIVLA
jgi:hypothetical protein